MTAAMAREEMEEIINNSKYFHNTPLVVKNRYFDLSNYLHVCDDFNYFARLCPRTLDICARKAFWEEFLDYAKSMRHITTELLQYLEQENLYILQLASETGGVDRFYAEYVRFSKYFFKLWVSEWNTPRQKTERMMKDGEQGEQNEYSEQPIEGGGI